MSFRHIAILAVLLAVVIAAQGRPYEDGAKAKIDLGPHPYRLELKTLDRNIEEDIAKRDQAFKTEVNKLREDVGVENKITMAAMEVPHAKMDKTGRPSTQKAAAKMDRDPEGLRTLNDVRINIYKPLMNKLKIRPFEYKMTELNKLREDVRVENMNKMAAVEVPQAKSDKIGLDDKTVVGNTVVLSEVGDGDLNRNLKASDDIAASWLYESMPTSSMLLTNGADLTTSTSLANSAEKFYRSDQPGMLIIIITIQWNDLSAEFYQQDAEVSTQIGITDIMEAAQQLKDIFNQIKAKIESGKIQTQTAKKLLLSDVDGKTARGMLERNVNINVKPIYDIDADRLAEFKEKAELDRDFFAELSRHNADVLPLLSITDIMEAAQQLKIILQVPN